MPGRALGAEFGNFLAQAGDQLGTLRQMRCLAFQEDFERAMLEGRYVDAVLRSVDVG